VRVQISALHPRKGGQFIAGKRREELGVADDPEIVWHKEQIAKNRAVLEELESGNTAGGDIFPETQAEIDRLKAQITQSELIVAAYHKNHPELR
jgi:hypothetical protein